MVFSWANYEEYSICKLQTVHITLYVDESEGDIIGCITDDYEEVGRNELFFKRIEIRGRNPIEIRNEMKKALENAMPSVLRPLRRSLAQRLSAVEALENELGKMA